MKMERVEILEGLPPLSWLLNVHEDKLIVYAGSRVEVFENGVFEGCWEGTFASYDFHCCDNVFGSGFRLHDNSIRFVTPTHTLESLYAVVKESGFSVSNSIAFLMTFREIELPFKQPSNTPFSDAS